VLHNTILTPAESGVATPGVAALGAFGPSLRDTRCGAICQVNIVSVHIGLKTAGVLESGQHYEFTVVGDAVNVAQRLERLAKKLDAVLVVSAAILERRLPRCLSPGFDSAPLSADLRDAL